MKQHDRSFYKTILAIAIPIALQNIISYSVSLMDTVMLGEFGEVALSATALANQMFFIFTILCFGIAGGAIVLTSQYWGKRDTAAIQKIIAIAVKLTVAAALVFTLVVFLLPSQCMSIFTSEQPVIAAGADYLRIVSLSYLFFGVASTVLTILRSVENVKISLLIYTISFFVNVFFNYVFIFGKFGAPAMGITGAAVGTLIARITEFVLMCAYMLFVEKKIRFRLSMLSLTDHLLFSDLIRYGLPVMLNELFWSLGTSMHSVILGHMGSDIVAANSICYVLYQIGISSILGVGNASAVIVGNSIGAGRIDYAKQSVKRFEIIYLGIGIFSALLLLAVKTPFISIYDISDSTRQVAEQLMYAYAVSIFFMSFSCPMIMGILRGSGDTRFAGLTDVGCLWACIPLGAFAAFVLGWPALVVFSILKLDMLIKTFICLWRLRTDRWIKNVTHTA